MTLRLPRAMIEEMVAHARDDLPNEACGIISGRDGVAHKLFRMRNSEASPYRYNIHPIDLKNALEENDEHGWDILVIYHSHVASEAYPSPTDIRLSQWPGTDPPQDLWPGAYYVLVSLQDRDAAVVRAYRISAGKVDEVTVDAV
jgi:[CysO sulfur-carrier protein]-S-L-cysteine hydrolase